MKISEMAAKEMRDTNPSKDQLIEAFACLIELGWKPIPDAHPGQPAYTSGWWIHSGHPTKCRPVGDSKNFHFGAWDTIKAYIAK